MGTETRLIRVDGDQTAYEDQIRAVIAEARRVNPPQYQNAIEHLAAHLRADITRDHPDVRDHRALLAEVLGRVNALQLSVFPDTAEAVGTVQSVLIVALYGQPGDDT